MREITIKSGVMRVFLFSLFIVNFSLFIGCGNPIIQRIVGAKTITFESNGGSKVENQTVFKDRPVRRPPDPSKPGYNFASWYRDNEIFENEWNFDAIPDAEMTLYAKWNIKELIPITNAAISITEPETDAAPSTVASGTGNFTIGAVSWNPADNPFQAGVEYTATVTLTAHEDYFFAEELNSTTINGNDATVVTNTASTLTLVYTFPPTRTVTGMEVKTQPGKLVYNHGDELDLSELVVQLTYNIGPNDVVAYNEFASKGIEIIELEHNMVLSHLAHDSKHIMIKCGTLPLLDAGTLTVNKKALAITGAVHTKTYDGDTSTTGLAITLEDGIVSGDIVTVGTITAEYTSPNAGTTTVNITNVTLTGADEENYTVTLPLGSISVAGITKKNPTVVWPTNLTAFYGQKLSDIVPDGNGTYNPSGVFSWVEDLDTLVGAVGTQTHAMRFTPSDTINYNIPTQNVNIAVAKAAGVAVSAPTATDANIFVNSVTLTAVTITPANGQTVQYGWSLTDNAATATWQTETSIGGLTGGTKYYFFARSVSNDNYNTGTASAGTEITTKQNIGITITVEQLIDEIEEFDSGVILSRTGEGYSETQEVPVIGLYDSITWEIKGVGVHKDQSVSKTTAPIELDATNTIYNSPGWHTVTVTVTVGTMQYMRSFRFRIVE